MAANKNDAPGYFLVLIWPPFLVVDKLFYLMQVIVVVDPLVFPAKRSINMRQYRRSDPTMNGSSTRETGRCFLLSLCMAPAKGAERP